MNNFALAFEDLSRAIEEKTAFVNLLAVEPFFNPLRSDGRFTSFLRKLNLPHERRSVLGSRRSSLLQNSASQPLSCEHI